MSGIQPQQFEKHLVENFNDLTQLTQSVSVPSGHKGSTNGKFMFQHILLNSFENSKQPCFYTHSYDRVWFRLFLSSSFKPSCVIPVQGVRNKGEQGVRNKGKHSE